MLDPQFMLPGKAAPLSLQSSEQARQKDMIPGFVKAKEVVTPKVFPPPKIPADYQPRHRPAPQTSSGVLTSILSRGFPVCAWLLYAGLTLIPAVRLKAEPNCS